MSEVQNDGGKPGSPPSGKPAGLLWAALGLIAVLAVLYGAIALVFKSGREEGLKPLVTGEMAKLVVADKPGAPPNISAKGPDGEPVTLAGFKGQIVVVNLWATWCAPCVKEMPALAKLQSAYAGQAVKVVPISLDKGDADIAKARAFIADKAPLRFYHGDYNLAFTVVDPPAEGLPTTILYDRTGHERARLSGGADWSTPEAHAVIDRLLKLKS